MDSKESYKLYKHGGSPVFLEDIFTAGWNAAIAYIKENYVLCEKEPVSLFAIGLAPRDFLLYREAKHED